MKSSSSRCKISNILIIFFLIIFISYIIYINAEANLLKNKIINNSKKELFSNECYKKQQYTEDSIKYPIMSPNIPIDNEQQTKIGYDGDNIINEPYDNPTGINNLCVKLIKPLLKYDGIFLSKRGFDDTTEIQSWHLSNKKGMQSTYGNNKLLPPKNYPF